jgi:hypothetical protein
LFTPTMQHPDCRIYWGFPSRNPDIPGHFSGVRPGGQRLTHHRKRQPVFDSQAAARCGGRAKGVVKYPSRSNSWRGEPAGGVTGWRLVPTTDGPARCVLLWTTGLHGCGRSVGERSCGGVTLGRRWSYGRSEVALDACSGRRCCCLRRQGRWVVLTWTDGAIWTGVPYELLCRSLLG